MSLGVAKIFGMDPPDMVETPIEEVPSYEDEQRELEQRRLLEEQEKKEKVDDLLFLLAVKVLMILTMKTLTKEIY